MSVKQNVGRVLLPKAAHLAPGLSSGFVREALHRAIRGVGPLPPAAEAAEKQLAEQDGDVERAIREVIENHVRYASAQGFVTNLGGLVTAAVTIPVNVTGLALVQSRMIAGIAHLRGYDLEDPRVRNALLVALLGEEEIEKLLKRRKIPAPPMALATAPAHDPTLDRLVSAEVASAMLAKVAGKQVVTTVGRRIPVLGGLVGAGSDGWYTWRIGRYVEKELLPRARR